MDYKTNMKKIILSLFATLMLSSCFSSDPPLIPLSKSELIELKELKTELEKTRKRNDAYESEKNRISELQESYLKDFIRLNEFSIYKTNGFDDGRYRACYKGFLVNKGKEIIEEIYLNVTFYSKKTGEKINNWNTGLVDANDDFLDNSEDTEAKSLIYALSGRKLPLKPNEKINLSKGKTCYSEVFLDWESKDIKYELVGLKLRPQLSEVTVLDEIKISIKIGELEERANEFKQ